MYINQLSEPSLTRECRNDKTIVKCKYLMHFIFIMNIYNSNYYKYNLFVDSVHIMHADYCFINLKIPHAIFFFNWEQTSFIDKYKVPIYIILHPTLLFIIKIIFFFFTCNIFITLFFSQKDIEYKLGTTILSMQCYVFYVKPIYFKQIIKKNPVL